MRSFVSPCRHVLTDKKKYERVRLSARLGKL